MVPLLLALSCIGNDRPYLVAGCLRALYLKARNEFGILMGDADAQGDTFISHECLKYVTNSDEYICNQIVFNCQVA
jgi:hypothetical protein